MNVQCDDDGNVAHEQRTRDNISYNRAVQRSTATRNKLSMTHSHRHASTGFHIKSKTLSVGGCRLKENTAIALI